MGAAGAATRRLFGTDGVRGVAGEFLSAELALALARAATARIQGDAPARVLVIRDTRESGAMLEAAVAAGIAAAGGEALLGGVLPTPAAPLLVRRHGYDLAIVLSASHNPYQDNGIKFFGGDGFKLDDATELEIEGLIETHPPAPRVGAVRRIDGALGDYLEALHERFAALDLRGRRIVLDCANGATYRGRAGDLPPPRRRRDGDGGRSPTGATSTPAAGPRTSTTCAPRWPATTPVSRSTATATACSPSTAQAPWWTATS